MDMRKEHQSNTILNRRTILAVIVIVSSVTASNLLLHRGDPQLGYARYEGFGFTLDYSQRMDLREDGFGGPEVNESGGSVQVSFQGYGVEQYGVLWTLTKNMPSHMRDLEGGLNYIFSIAAMDGTTFSGFGAYRSTVHNGHEMAYQSFILEEQGFDIPGIMGGVSCEETGQFLWFYFIYLPDPENPSVDPQELEQGWLGYLEGFRCQA